MAFEMDREQIKMGTECRSMMTIETTFIAAGCQCQRPKRVSSGPFWNLYNSFGWLSVFFSLFFHIGFMAFAINGAMSMFAIETLSRKKRRISSTWKLKITDAFPSRLDLLYAVAAPQCALFVNLMSVSCAFFHSDAVQQMQSVTNEHGTECCTWTRVTLYRCERRLNLQWKHHFGDQLFWFFFLLCSHFKSVQIQTRVGTQTGGEKKEQASKWKRKASRLNGWQWQIPNWHHTSMHKKHTHTEWQTIEFCGFYASYSVFVFQLH